MCRWAYFRCEDLTAVGLLVVIYEVPRIHAALSETFFVWRFLTLFSIFPIMKWCIVAFCLLWICLAVQGDQETVDAQEPTLQAVDLPAPPQRPNFHQVLRKSEILGSTVVKGVAELFSSRKDESVGAFSLDDLDNVSIGCLDSLGILLGYSADPTNLPEWLLRFLDAQAKPPSAIFEGNIVWLGGFHECMNLSVFVNTTKTAPAPDLFEGQYCLMTIDGGKPLTNTTSWPRTASPLMQIPRAISAGICVPHTCSERDVLNIAQVALQFLDLKYPIISQENVSIIDVRCPAKNIPMDGPAIGVVITLVIFTTLVLIGTLYDVLTNGVFLEGDDRFLVENSLNTSHYTTLVPPENIEGHPVYVKEGRSLLAAIFLSFSAVSNSRRIFRCGTVLGELPWIHGMRVLSMLWIVLGQTYALGLPVYDNLALLPDAMKGLFTQIIVQSVFAVDTFLFLSGFLVAYRFLQEIANGFDCMRLIRFYVNRYLRLFPVYMVVLGIYAALTKYMSSGPLWPQDEMRLGNCSSLAWTNAFYINNYVQPEQMCMPWTWYIAIDFQLFIIAPLVVLALSVLWYAGVALCFAAILVAVISAGVISRVMELPPSLVGFGSTDASAFDQDLTVKFFTSYLITTYCRAAPYFIGILTAWFLRDVASVRRSSFMGLVLGWTVAVISVAVVVFALIPGFNGYPLSVDAAAAFNSLSHVLFAGALAWIAYSCMTGAVKGVDRVLGWAVWRPLSGISYSVFLISPIIISAYYLSREETIRFTHWNALTLFAGNLFFSFLIGYLIYIIVEAPVRSLMRMIWRRLATPEPRISETNGTH